MISAEMARKNLESHEKRAPIKSISTISEMIRVASTLGFQEISIFIHLKDKSRIKTRLINAGFLTETVFSNALPDEVLIIIKWNTSKLVGSTIKHID